MGETDGQLTGDLVLGARGASYLQGRAARNSSGLSSPSRNASWLYYQYRNREDETNQDTTDEARETVEVDNAKRRQGGVKRMCDMRENRIYKQLREIVINNCGIGSGIGRL